MYVFGSLEGGGRVASFGRGHGFVGVCVDIAILAVFRSGDASFSRPFRDRGRSASVEQYEADRVF